MVLVVVVVLVVDVASVLVVLVVDVVVVLLVVVVDELVVVVVLVVDVVLVVAIVVDVDVVAMVVDVDVVATVVDVEVVPMMVVDVDVVPTMVVEVDVVLTMVVDVVFVCNVVEVVVVVQPVIGVFVQPVVGEQVSAVQAFPSLQFGARQLASQHAFTVPVSHVSGNSTTWLPHVGHGIRQLLCPKLVHAGSNVMSLGASGGENVPVTGGVAPFGRMRKFRLEAFPPVVFTCAPLSTTSALRDEMVFFARLSPVVSMTAVEERCTVHPSSKVVPFALASVEWPLACTLPLRVRSPGVSGDPATSVMVPPELSVALPPSPLISAVDVIVKPSPASRSTQPAELAPDVETLASAVRLTAPFPSAVTPPPLPVVTLVIWRTAVTAAFRLMPLPEQKVMQPPSDVPSA